MSDKVIYVLIENIKIKEYLFGCSKLKLIRGASYALDYANTSRCKGKFENDYKMKSTEIYFGGGNIKALFTNENDARDFIDDVKRIYNEVAPGSKVIAAYCEGDVDGGLTNLEDQVRSKLEEKKSAYYDSNYVVNAFIQKCEFCGLEPAAVPLKLSKTSGKTNYICCMCNKKYENKSPNNEIYRKLKNRYKLDSIRFTEEINEIADKNNDIAFINADGNRMGEFLKVVKRQIKLSSIDKDKESYANVFKGISEAIDNSTKYAAVEAVHKYIKVDEKGLCKVEYILAGGDDLVMVVPGDKGIIIAAEFARIFEEKIFASINKVLLSMEDNKIKSFFADIMMVKKLRITSGIGVVVAKSSYPVKDLFELSSQLQKRSKKLSFEIYREKEISLSTLDIHVLKNSVQNGLDNLRSSKYYGSDTTVKTIRPFYIPPISDIFTGDMDNESDVDSSNNFKNIQVNEKNVLGGYYVHNFDDFLINLGNFKEKVPNVKLRQLNTFIDLECNEAALESIRFMAKLKSGAIKSCCGNLLRYNKSFPWMSYDIGDYYTDIRDIVELADVIEDKDIGEYERSRQE